MSKVLVIGAGGVGSVAVHKMAMNPQIFSDVHLASRTKSKCDAIAESVKQRTGPDGMLLDVCESTNKQRTLEDYLRRAAIAGRDPRGGAMAMIFATEMAGLN